ncbi:adenosine deaminase family protein [Saccharothrix sp. NRRL B-16348]|uniref:adenosine deaminase family protein n=1 Tax=Saccharothrix sp. NRRL B-16348 TaxID=1415542 RepID=UPI0006ADA451|nr:adenosine deaminase [Saccharothrix sp. NRRL B-16348]
MRALRTGLAGLSVVAVGLLASSLLVGVAPAVAGESGVERYLDTVRDDPARLDAFLRELPKGGDLHTHLSGAVTTETLIALAAADGMCVNLADFKAVAGPCGAGQRPAADAETDPAFRAEVISQWSMEGFRPSAGQSGHDHFFAAFGKTGAITSGHRPEMLADVLDKAGRQHESYMETMTTRQGGAVFELAQGVEFNEDFAAMHRQVLAEGRLAGIVAAARAETDRDEARYRELLGCGTEQASPGCGMTVRYIHQVSRNSEPNAVFTSMVYGFELAEADGRNVALNLVQPEDGEVSLRDYRLHMRMLAYLRGAYGKAHITLHAGELVPGLVKPEELTYHIREAVEVGRAERVGHAVDVLHEDDWPELMRLMRARHVMVESPLTSNAQILEVSGWEHPFPTYRSFDVPIALATDDEGISRTDLTREYARATTDYRLRYGDLKTLARTSLDHAFLDGERLWRGPDDYTPATPCARDQLGAPEPSATCRAFLDANAKAALQWAQEAAFNNFERRYS